MVSYPATEAVTCLWLLVRSSPCQSRLRRNVSQHRCRIDREADFRSKLLS